MGYWKNKGKRGLALFLALLMSLNLLSLSALAAEESDEIAAARAALAEAQADYEAAKAGYDAKQADYDAAYAAWQAAQEQPEAGPEDQADPEEAPAADGEDADAPGGPAEEAELLAEAVAAAQAAVDEAKAAMDEAQAKLAAAQTALDALLAAQEQPDDAEVPPEADGAPPAEDEDAPPAEGEQAEPQGTEFVVPDAPERAAGEREYVLVTAADLVDGKLKSGYYAIRASGTTLYCTSGSTTVDQCSSSVRVAGNKLTMDSHLDCHVWLIMAVDGGYVVQSMGGGSQYFAYGTADDTSKHFPVSDQLSIFQINYPALDKTGQQIPDRFTISWMQGEQELFINRSSKKWHAYSGGWGVPIELYREQPVAAEPEPTLPEPGEGEMWAYVSYNTASGGDKWGLNENPYTVKLYPDSNSTEATSIADGIYRINAPATGDSNARWMHVDNGNNKNQTNQCKNDTCGDAHKFQFTRTEDGCYTIKSVASTSQDRYLGTCALGSYNQIPMTETPVKFVITAVEDGFTIAAIVEKPPVDRDQSGDPAPIYPTAGLGNAIVYEEATGALKDNGTVYAILDGTTGDNGSPRLLHHEGSDNTNQCQTTITSISEGNDRISLGGCGTKHLWILVPVEGGYLLKNCSSNKYLTTTASGTQLKVDGTGTSVFTVEQAEGGRYVMSGGKYLDFNGGNGWKMTDSPNVLRFFSPASAPIEGEEARTVFKGTGAPGPMDKNATDSQYFRIPALITLNNGWLVAASDIRWRTSADNPANLDTIVSISKDNGQTWDWEVVNYFGDYAHDAASNKFSASFIDPALVQAPDGKVWMFVDVTSADGKSTGGSTGYDDQGRLLVAHVPGEYVGARAPGDTSLYTYYVSTEGVERIVGGESVTLYPIESTTGAEDCAGLFVDAFMNLYYTSDEGVERVMCLQEGSNKIVQNSLFYKQSEWRVFPTCYLMLRSATVTSDGLVWDDPIFPNLRYEGQTQPFFGACPGRGFVTDDECIIFPVYDNATGNELASVIYSDNNGETWQRGARTLDLNDTRKSSESQIVRLPDGTLRMYSRNLIGYISYADSSDGGQTWGTSYKDEALVYVGNCMVSFINIEGTLNGPDGETYGNLILASYPKGGGRQNGVIRIGSISEGEGHPVTWLNDDAVRYPGPFVYSCLTQIQENGTPTDQFGMLYETNDSTSRIGCYYTTVSVADLLGEGWTLTQGGGPVVPGNVRVTDASGADIEAVAGLYAIPAGGMVYVDGSPTFTVPMGVKEIRVPAGKAGDLVLGDNGSVALEGMAVVMPDGEESSGLMGSGQCGDGVYYALIKDENRSTAKKTYSRIHISGSGPMWDFVLNKYHDDELARPYAALASTIRSAKIYNGVTHIGNHAFHLANLSEGVELPNDGQLQSIGEGAFHSATVPNAGFALPDGVTTIGREAFRGFGPYPQNAIPFVLPESVTEIGEYVFAYSTVGTITIPGGVGAIPVGAFQNDQYLTEVTIQEGVTEIGASAFECSNSFRGEVTITLPDTLATIGDKAFRSYKVQRLTIPAGVQRIGSDVFHSGLYWLYFKGAPLDIAGDAFKEELKIASNTDEIRNIAVLYAADTQVLETLQGLDIQGRYVFGNLNGHTIRPYWKGSVAILEEPFRADGSPAIWFTEDGAPLTTRYPSADETKPGLADIPGGVDAAPGSVFIAQLVCSEHSWSQWTEEIPAACTAAGEEIRTCGKCGETETRVIEALGHDLASHEAQAATCTEAGWNAYEACSRCDYTTKVEIAALGHDFTGGEWSSNADGHWHVCARVGCEAEETHAAHAPETIPAVPATYDAPGKTEGSLCSVCGYVITEPQDTPQLTRPGGGGGGGGGGTPAPTPPVEVEEIEEPEVPLAALPLPFEDVTDADWYREAVAYVWSNNLMLGTSDKLFGVEANTTRGMMATVLYRLEEEPGIPFEKVFSDVDSGKWFSQAIAWANANGVAVGYDNGSFGPDDNVTREQLVTMLYRYAVMRDFDVSGKADLSAFADVDEVNDYARDAMSWAVSEGIIMGRGADLLAPGSLALRVEVAAIFQRFAARYMDAAITA